MLPLREWLASPEYLAVKKLSMGDLVSKEFFVDPLRPVYIRPEVFYSPADGVILYAFERIGPNEAIVNVKGKKFTVRELLDDDEYDHPSLVIGIFMTAYDKHVNRCPTAGYAKEYRCTPFLYNPQISMVEEERGLLEDAEIDKADMGYLFMSERKVISVYNPRIRNTYFVIQVADRDIDVILNWFKQGYMIQAERMGQIRYGSQVDLVIPLVGKAKYELLCKRGLHVEAGTDALVKIIS